MPNAAGANIICRADDQVVLLATLCAALSPKDGAVALACFTRAGANHRREGCCLRLWHGSNGRHLRLVGLVGGVGHNGGLLGRLPRDWLLLQLCWLLLLIVAWAWDSPCCLLWLLWLLVHNLLLRLLLVVNDLLLRLLRLQLVLWLLNDVATAASRHRHCRHRLLLLWNGVRVWHCANRLILLLWLLLGHAIGGGHGDGSHRLLAEGLWSRSCWCAWQWWLDLLTPVTSHDVAWFGCVGVAQLHSISMRLCGGVIGGRL